MSRQDRFSRSGDKNMGSSFADKLKKALPPSPDKEPIDTMHHEKIEAPEIREQRIDEVKNFQESLNNNITTIIEDDGSGLPKAGLSERELQTLRSAEARFHRVTDKIPDFPSFTVVNFYDRYSGIAGYTVEQGGSRKFDDGSVEKNVWSGPATVIPRTELVVLENNRVLPRKADFTAKFYREIFPLLIKNDFVLPSLRDYLLHSLSSAAIDLRLGEYLNYQFEGDCEFNIGDPDVMKIFENNRYSKSHPKPDFQFTFKYGDKNVATIKNVESEKTLQSVSLTESNTNESRLIDGLIKLKMQLETQYELFYLLLRAKSSDFGFSLSSEAVRKKIELLDL